MTSPSISPAHAPHVPLSAEPPQLSHTVRTSRVTYAVPGTLGERVVELRVRRGLSQGELGRPEVSDSYISLIESGKRTPSSAVVNVLARKLGCSTFYLENGVTEKYLTDWTKRLRHARTVLDRGLIKDAISLFMELVKCPVLDVFPDLFRQVHRGFAMSLEADGQLSRAIEEFEHAAGEVSGMGWAEWVSFQVSLCRCHYKQGDLEQVITVAENALMRVRREGADGSEAGIRLGIALFDAYRSRGDVFSARRLANQLARAVDAEAGSRLSRLPADRVQDIQARPVRPARRTPAVSTEDTDVDAISGSCTIERARLLLLLDRPGDAERAYALLTEHKSELAATDGNVRDLGVFLTILARADLKVSQPHEAAAHAQRATELLGNRAGCDTAEAVAVRGLAYACLNEPEEAIRLLSRAAHLMEQAGRPDRAAQIWYDTAEVQRHTGINDRMLIAIYQHALALTGIHSPAAAPAARRLGPCSSAS